MEFLHVVTVRALCCTALLVYALAPVILAVPLRTADAFLPRSLVEETSKDSAPKGQLLLLFDVDQTLLECVLAPMHPASMEGLSCRVNPDAIPILDWANKTAHAPETKDRVYPVFHTWTSGIETQKKFSDAASRGIALNLKHPSNPAAPRPSLSLYDYISDSSIDASDLEASETKDNVDLSVYFSSPSQILQRDEALARNLYGPFATKDIERLRQYWRENNIVENLDSKIVLLFDDQEDVYTYNVCYRHFDKVMPIVIHPFSGVPLSHFEGAAHPDSIGGVHLAHHGSSPQIHHSPSLHECLERMETLIEETNESATTDELMQHLTKLFPPPTGTECHYDIQNPAPLYTLLTVSAAWLRQNAREVGYWSTYMVFKEFFDTFGGVKVRDTNPLLWVSAGSYTKVSIICEHSISYAMMCHELQLDLLRAHNNSPHSKEAPTVEVFVVERPACELAHAKFKSRLPYDRTLMVSLVEEITTQAISYWPEYKKAEHICQIETNGVTLEPTETKRPHERNRQFEEVVTFVAQTVGEMSQVKTEKNLVPKTIDKILSGVAQRVRPATASPRVGVGFRPSFKTKPAALAQNLKLSDSSQSPFRILCTDLDGNAFHYPTPYHAAGQTTTVFA